MRALDFGQSWLFESRTPEELLCRVDAEKDKLGWGFVISREAKGLREAWVLGSVARLLGASNCRLAQSDPPDGYLGFANRPPIPVEVTELIHAGRRRGTEVDECIRNETRHRLDEAITCNLP